LKVAVDDVDQFVAELTPGRRIESKTEGRHSSIVSESLVRERRRLQQKRQQALSGRLLGRRRGSSGSGFRRLTPSRLDGTGDAASSLHTQLRQQPLRECDVAEYG